MLASLAAAVLSAPGCYGRTLPQSTESHAFDQRTTTTVAWGYESELVAEPSARGVIQMVRRPLCRRVSLGHLTTENFGLQQKVPQARTGAYLAMGMAAAVAGLSLNARESRSTRLAAGGVLFAGGFVAWALPERRQRLYEETLPAFLIGPAEPCGDWQPVAKMPMRVELADGSGRRLVYRAASDPEGLLVLPVADIARWAHACATRVRLHIVAPTTADRVAFETSRQELLMPGPFPLSTGRRDSWYERAGGAGAPSETTWSPPPIARVVTPSSTSIGGGEATDAGLPAPLAAIIDECAATAPPPSASPPEDGAPPGGSGLRMRRSRQPSPSRERQ